MEKELQAVLTPEQLEKYQALRRERGMMFGKPGPEPGPDFHKRFRDRDKPPPGGPLPR